MKIDVHITCWNEEVMLPFTLEHYSSFCNRIFIYDNMSDDKTLSICKKFPKVITGSWQSKTEKGKFNDNEARYIKYKGYKRFSKGKSDWVILADCDELIYHPHIRKILMDYRREGINYPVVQGCNMVGAQVPKYFPRAKITNILKTGVKNDPFPPSEIFSEEKAWGYSKPIIFTPHLDVFLSLGSHFINGEKSDTSKFVFSDSADIKLLHYKNLSEEYVVNRCKQLGERLSKYNIENEYGLEWLQKENTLREQHRKHLSLAETVI
jgi:glycosyltransferase involved in cell wall biosynthesis